jgi:N-acetylneuraminate synthase/sialic acid synthase
MRKVSEYSRRELSFGGRQISDDSQAFIIAELGHNHQGSLDTCLQMIRAAAFAGASAVKLQKRNNRELFTDEAFNAPYNSENAFGSTYGEHREALEFGVSEYKACIEEANRNKIIFFATAFDFSSADFLAELNVPGFKMASGDLKSLPLLKYVAKMGKPMIISTGGASLQDVDAAVATIKKEGTPLAVLQCTAAYPPKYEELNLNVIKTFRDRYPDVVVGYSGHDSGIAMSLAAYILGARVIEKHFTLNRAMKGTDHAFSLEPDGMRKLVRDLDRARLALGSGVKDSYPSEIEPLKKMGKKIVAIREIKIGSVICQEDLGYKSPGDGLSPALADTVIGKRTSRLIQPGETLTINDFE